MEQSAGSQARCDVARTSTAMPGCIAPMPGPLIAEVGLMNGETLLHAAIPPPRAQRTSQDTPSIGRQSRSTATKPASVARSRMELVCTLRHAAQGTIRAARRHRPVAPSLATHERADPVDSSGRVTAAGERYRTCRRRLDAIRPTDVDAELLRSERLEKRSFSVVWVGFAFALLQSVCSFAIAASGLRVAIGVGSALLSAITSAPVQAFHGAVFRVPMLLFSIIGACINLGLLWQVRRLRARPAAQWRRQPLSSHTKRMETLQLSLSVATLLLVAVEVVAHHRIHGVYLFVLV
jgi:hypothetical protein